MASEYDLKLGANPFAIKPPVLPATGSLRPAGFNPTSFNANTNPFAAVSPNAMRNGQSFLPTNQPLGEAGAVYVKGGKAGTKLNTSF